MPKIPRGQKRPPTDVAKREYKLWYPVVDTPNVPQEAPATVTESKVEIAKDDLGAIELPNQLHQSLEVAGELMQIAKEAFNILKNLRAFEIRTGISSDEFSKLWYAGLAPDTFENNVWISFVEARDALLEATIKFRELWQEKKK